MIVEAKRFPNGCVASPHYLASAAGQAVLAQGGNALDAAIATNLTLGVVTPYVCGYGGDLFAIVHTDGEVHAYMGCGRAPEAATPQVVEAAAGTDTMPRFGPFAVTVPGAVEAWFTLIERFGTRSFAELARTPLRLARDGFELTARGSEIIELSKHLYRDKDWAAAWRGIYEDAAPGVPMVQPDLARTIETLASDGPDAYYRGPIAEAIAGTLSEGGMPMATDDLASHAGEWTEPLRTTYRDLEVLELPPPTQGVTALEALNIIEGYDLGPPGDADREHLLLEAFKLALADRQGHVTDPDHMSTDPVELASKGWAAERRARIDPERASMPAAGRPAAEGDTVYLCAADGDGMCVSLIQSNFFGFGSGVTVPGWGINLQNRGSSFSLDPDDVNVIAPRKRPRHTLIPALALRDGRPWLVFGTMGGDGQASTHLQLLTRIVDDGEDIQRAINAPRWIVSPDDWTVTFESRFPADLLGALRDRGHEVDVTEPYHALLGHAHAILVTENGYAAAFDPRSEGAALGL